MRRGQIILEACEQCRTEQVGYKLNHSVLIKIIVIITIATPICAYPRDAKKVMDITNFTSSRCAILLTANKTANVNITSEEKMGILSWIIFGLIAVFGYGSCRVKMADL